MSNFFYSAIASGKDMGMFFTNLIYNKSFTGFIAGIFVTTLIIGFILTKNPRHIPIILRYSEVESFQRLAQRDENGTYRQAFSAFVRIYTRVRTLFVMSFIIFIVMIITAMINYTSF